MITCPLAQAGTLYVDNVSNCMGLTTCYSSIQEALNNAVTDDEIRIFPGTYPEAVDLSLMGSALGVATDGNLRFITVDENNNVAARTVQVSPLNGSAFTHSNNTFDGNLEFDGLVVLSTDDDGIDFDAINGNITMRNMTASGNNKDGIDLEINTSGYSIGIYDSITDNNGDRGLNLDGPDATEVIIRNTQANNNIDEGISVEADSIADALDVTILDSLTQNNGDTSHDSAGIVVVSVGSLLVSNLYASDNHGPGLAIIDVTETTILDSIFERNAVTEEFSGIFLESAGVFLVTRSIFSDNGYAGVNVYETFIPGNELTALNINCSSFSGNQLGVLLNDSAEITASYNINHSNFINHTIAGIHAALENDAIAASNNWWGDATGPTHSDNIAGMGDRVSDSIDDAIGGALGTVNYLPFVMAPISIKQYPTDILFAGDFDGNICSQL